jgi:hypothetical protein
MADDKELIRRLIERWAGAASRRWVVAHEHHSFADLS